MSDNNHIKKRYEQSRCDEHNATVERDYRQRVANDQESHLSMLLDYRDECVDGLKNAKESGLTIIQMREYQLLMAHLSTVIEKQQCKLELSHERLEDAQNDWKLKHDLYMQLKQQVQDIIEAEKKETEETLVNDVPASLNRHNTSRISGKRFRV